MGEGRGWMEERREVNGRGGDGRKEWVIAEVESGERGEGSWER